MARLPQPGGDDGNWGTLLNDYLAQAHTSSGGLKPNVVGSAQLNAASPSDGQVLSYSTSGLVWATPASAIASGTTAQYYRGDKTWQNLDKTAVGLANVDNTTDANKPISTAAAAAFSGKINFVLVSTGSEARPTGSFCIWSGGTTQPTNMGANDIWFASSPPPDTTAPSVPSGLSSSSVGSAGFTLSWVASTGLPTLYEVFVDGNSAGTTTLTNLNTSGLTADADHNATVRARDAAGNWSAQSSALVVHTTPTGSAVTHSQFASTVPAGTANAYSDGGGTLSFGNSFYTATIGTEAWKLQGARFYVSALNLAQLPANARVAFRYTLTTMTSGNTTLSNSAWSAASATQVVSGILVAGWNEVTFTAPVDYATVLSGNGQAIWILAMIGTGSNPATAGGNYYTYNSTGSSSQATDGSFLYGGDAAFRGWNSIAGTVSSIHYGLDVIVSES